MKADFIHELTQYNGFDVIRIEDLDLGNISVTNDIENVVVSRQTGDVIDIAGSSADLSIPEFGEYIERICQWAAEYLNVVIPSPNEQLVVFEEWEQKIVNENI